MKSLLEIMEASKDDLPEIYCDMDDVLVNFMKGAENAIGGDFASIDKDERWNKINQTKGFWENLDWMPSAKRLYQFIQNMIHTFYLLTLGMIPHQELVK